MPWSNIHVNRCAHVYVFTHHTISLSLCIRICMYIYIIHILYHIYAVAPFIVQRNATFLLMSCYRSCDLAHEVDGVGWGGAC